MPNVTSENETVRALETKYKAAENAFISKDIDAVATLMSPEFIGFDENGTRKTRNDVLESVRKQFETSNIISWPRKVTNLATDGDIVTATVEGVYKGEKLQDHEPFQMLLINEDKWQRTPSGWTMIGSRAINDA